MDTNWLKELEQQLVEVANLPTEDKAVEVVVEEAPKEPIKKSTMILGAAVIVVLLNVVFFVWCPRGIATVDYVSRYFHKGQRSETPVLSMPVEPKVDKHADLSKRQQITSDKLTLVAIVQNHNNYVIRQGLPLNEIIYINGDWTIDRMPNHISMTPEAEEFLKRFVKAPMIKNPEATPDASPDDEPVEETAIRRKAL